MVKAFAREESEIAAFEKLNREYVRRSVTLIRLWGLFYPMLSALIGLSAVALLWYGGREVIAGKLTLGEFVAFLAYLAMLTWPTIATGWVINIFQRGAASMDRILRILQTEPEIRDLPGSCVPERGPRRSRNSRSVFSLPQFGAMGIARHQPDSATGPDTGHRRPDGHRQIDVDKPDRQAFRSGARHDFHRRP